MSRKLQLNRVQCLRNIGVLCWFVENNCVFKRHVIKPKLQDQILDWLCFIPLCAFVTFHGLKYGAIQFLQSYKTFQHRLNF